MEQYVQEWVRMLTMPLPAWVSIATLIVGMMLGRKTR